MHFEFVDTAAGSHIEVMRGEPNGPLVLMHPEAFGGIRADQVFAERLSGLGLTFAGMNPRGSGGSMGRMTGITLHDMAADAIAVIERYGSGPVVFIGHAGGNRVGRMVATMRPDLVRVLILLAAGGRVEPPAEVREAVRQWLNDALPWRERLLAAEHVFLAPGNHFPSTFPWPDYSFTANIAWRTAGEATNTDEWWPGGSAKILAIQGAQDSAAPPANGHLLADEFPDRVQVLDIEGAGHFPQLEKPEAVLDAISDFLRREGVISYPMGNTPAI
jgi:pimeloyl-ACP methyl ester carboxylesterase